MSSVLSQVRRIGKNLRIEIRNAGKFNSLTAIFKERKSNIVEERPVNRKLILNQLNDVIAG